MTHIANPDFADNVAASFDKQSAMHLIRATLPVVELGGTEIHLPRIGAALSNNTASFMAGWSA